MRGLAIPPLYFQFCASFQLAYVSTSSARKGTPMARKSPAQKLEDLLKALRAWEHLRPNRSFYGLTLEQFKQAIRPSLDARAELEDLDKRRRIVMRKRDAADVRSLRLRRGVVYAVQGDPAE